jgi:hypothetical protein
MAGAERSRQEAVALFHYVAHSRLVGIAWPEAVSRVERGDAAVCEEINEGSGTRGLPKPGVDGVEDLFSQASSLVFREHRNIGYLEDGAAIADDTTHAHGTPAMFDNDSEEGVGKRNANDLLTTRREASPCTERAVLRYGRVAYCDFVLLHHHFRSGASI